MIYVMGVKVNTCNNEKKIEPLHISPSTHLFRERDYAEKKREARQHETT